MARYRKSLMEELRDEEEQYYNEQPEMFDDYDLSKYNRDD